ncbi:MAG TPA: Asp-tRNA(Asn)/Glu-tRNA(Gln) amidotransferase subunit GatC [bacterium]|nr:Asp-tRNA(Asn)/Glu-tRNA(Gln) amidotransferase subunit GatC [bacterium]HOL48307.1 Asp-tRNA(Asn)/Glu-tRNA(Gln) amidotransferase subunit GatC [bacterium]HPQ19792.1 Asp-tRNA(Asn)/Glu-tRNA(Gln) amidotransferase subunit GatC [bacterium]
MQNKLTINDVKHIAKLSRLKLSDSEINLYTEQLNSILDYMKKLNELDTQGIEPTSHSIKISNVFRNDEVKESFQTDLMLNNAPDKYNNFYRVPKIIE